MFVLKTLLLFAAILILSNLPVPFVIAQNTISPLKQFSSGTSIDNIECYNNLVLILKKSDGSPTCVNPDTAQKLVERGWGKDWMVDVNVVRYTDNPKFGSIGSFPHQPIVKITQENLMKYPFLQSWMKTEDKLVANFNEFCKENNCMTLWQHLPSTVYYPKIGEITMREMIKDPALGFQISYELPTSNIYEVYIQVDGVNYGMSFFCRTHTCS